MWLNGKTFFFFLIFGKLFSHKDFSCSVNMVTLVSVESNVWYRRVFNKLFTSDNYYKSMQAMFFLTFLYGVTPFRVVTISNGHKRLSSSPFGYLNALLHVTVMAFCYAYTIRYNESIVGYFLSNNISNLGNKLYVLSGVIGATVVFISAIVRKKILEKSMKLFLEIDEHFKLIGQTVDYTAILRFVLLVLSLVALLDFTLTIIFVYCLKSMNASPSPCLVVIVVGECLGISLSISLFCSLTRSTQRRVRLLNQVS